jgi:hypothetical protein
MFDHRGAKGGDPGWSGSVDAIIIIIINHQTQLRKKADKRR